MAPNTQEVCRWVKILYASKVLPPFVEIVMLARHRVDAVLAQVSLLSFKTFELTDDFQIASDLSGGGRLGHSFSSSICRAAS